MTISYVFIIKLVLAPLLVAMATAAGYRFGPKVTGWLSGFPVVAGPLLLVFTLEQGPEFAAKAADFSLLGVVSLVGFCVTYLLVARNYHWALSVTSGWLFFVCCTYLLRTLESPWWLNALTAFLVIYLARRYLPRPNAPLVPRTVSMWDIPARMLATAVLVVALSEAASGLGSHVSGLLTPFPVVTAVIAVFSQRDQGFAGAARTLNGLLISMPAFVLFCLVMGLTLVPLGPALAFGIAMLLNVMLQLLALAKLRARS